MDWHLDDNWTLGKVKVLGDNSRHPQDFRFKEDGTVLIPSSPQLSQQANAEVNRIRAKYGRKPLMWSERAYHLALARAKDMNTYGYYDHVNPITGTCPERIKSQFSFKQDEYAAENLVAYSSSAFSIVSITDAISGWTDSRGHRFNLLYPHHTASAIACELNKCVFIAINSNGLGKQCGTAKEGQQFWQNAPIQEDEVIRRLFCPALGHNSKEKLNFLLCQSPSAMLLSSPMLITARPL